MGSMEDEIAELGECLIEEGIVTAEDIEAAQHAPSVRGTPLANLLSKVVAIRRAELAAFIGVDYSVPKIADLRQVGISQEATRLLPSAVAKKWTALPLAKAGDVLIVAAASVSREAIVEIRRATGLKVKLATANEKQLQAAIDRFYFNKMVDIPVIQPATALKKAPAARPAEEEMEAIPLFSGPDTSDGDIVVAQAPAKKPSQPPAPMRAVPVSRQEFETAQNAQKGVLKVLVEFEQTHLSTRPVHAIKV